MTLTTIAERLAVELSLPVYTTYVCRGWDSNIQPSAEARNKNILKEIQHFECCLPTSAKFRIFPFWLHVFNQETLPQGPGVYLSPSLHEQQR